MINMYTIIMIIIANTDRKGYHNWCCSFAVCGTSENTVLYYINSNIQYFDTVFM